VLSIKKDRLKELVESFKAQQIIVFGDLMLDEYLMGEVNRISPEAPVPIVEAEERTFRPGGAANAAVNIATMGGSPVLLGYCGKDWAGEQLIAGLAQVGLGGPGIIVDDEVSTTVKTRIIARRQQLLRIDMEPDGAPSQAAVDKLSSILRRGVQSAAGLLISDYCKGAVSVGVAEHAIDGCEESGIPSVIDSKYLDEARFGGAEMVTPNVSELGAITGVDVSTDEGIEEAAARLRETLGCRAAAITRGPDGISLFTPGAPHIDATPPEGDDGWAHTHLPAIATEVYDVTGAGDTVAAALTLAMSAGASDLEAAIIADLAAAIVVRRLGAAAPSSDEIIAMYEHVTEEHHF